MHKHSDPFAAVNPIVDALPSSAEQSMSRGFYIILAAQFFSSLGDNTLLFAAIALLKSMDAPSWQIPVLQQFFVFAFILLAPFVGAYSDALPKGQVMFISNGIKIVGCGAMLIALRPTSLLSFTGQTSTHNVQPVQSSGATCTVYANPVENSLNFDAVCLNISGASAINFSSYTL